MRVAAPADNHCVDQRPALAKFGDRSHALDGLVHPDAEAIFHVEKPRILLQSIDETRYGIVGSRDAVSALGQGEELPAAAAPANEDRCGGRRERGVDGIPLEREETAFVMLGAERVLDRPPVHRVAKRQPVFLAEYTKSQFLARNGQNPGDSINLEAPAHQARTRAHNRPSGLVRTQCHAANIALKSSAGVRSSDAVRGRVSPLRRSQMAYRRSS